MPYQAPAARPVRATPTEPIDPVVLEWAPVLAHPFQQIAVEVRGIPQYQQQLHLIIRPGAQRLGAAEGPSRCYQTFRTGEAGSASKL